LHRSSPQWQCPSSFSNERPFNWVEALEAAQQKIRSGPESPLVERVADAIAEQATSAGIVNDRPARAAILQVAMWLREQGTPASGWAMRLEQEASND
jgi:hypothetical protein